ncbi:MAG: hypothetical protein JO306_04845 [Gemmatimonadetes bacterium]|nr:hypothetical protein [Gemmatimonadota bacterium]
MIETLSRVLAERRAELRGDPAFVELEDFYNEMLRQGVAQKRGYEFPQLDTVGHSLTRPVHPSR